MLLKFGPRFIIWPRGPPPTPPPFQNTQSTEWYPFSIKRSIGSKVSCSRTRTHTLMTQLPEIEFDALNHSAMTPCLIDCTLTKLLLIVFHCCKALLLSTILICSFNIIHLEIFGPPIHFHWLFLKLTPYGGPFFHTCWSFSLERTPSYNS